MIDTSHILALSNRGFVVQQLLFPLSGGDPATARRHSFWRALGLPAVDVPLD